MRRVATLLIACFLFVLPFFWFRSGEMDLGGDSSRLYFYDPASYLRNYSLFAVSPSGFGAENIGFVTIPLVAILAVVKRFVDSPTLIIAAFHGMSLGVAFLSVYGSVMALLPQDGRGARYSHRIAGIAAGLLYTFSPISIFGWDKVLMTHNYVFLNPLLFYLLLRWTVSDRPRYLFFALAMTVIFSANFSAAAAPVFMAFYPITVAFLLLYRRLVLQKGIAWREILVAAGAFVGLQAFHLVPQIVSTFTPGSVLYTTVFTDVGKVGRGLTYFSAIAPSIQVARNLLLLPQMMTINPLLLGGVVIPGVVITAVAAVSLGGQKERRTFLLAASAFLVTMFFASANITNVGLAFYKKLFIIPGFSIFRNFYGQWIGALLFYYTLLFGLSVKRLLGAHNAPLRVGLAVLGLLLLGNAWPFLNGSLVNPVLWQSRDTRITIRMDPAFEEVISVIRMLPDDGKILTLPLTDPGYQIVAGADGGAYQGPSMTAYLTGRQDFAGFDELGRFKDNVLALVRSGQYEEFMDILALLNIRYVFYNADPKIYDEAFPAFPYSHVRGFLPKNQQEYRQFLERLPIHAVAAVDNRFFIYKVDDRYASKPLFVAEQSLHFDAAIHQWPNAFSLMRGSPGSWAFFEGENLPPAVDDSFLVAEAKSAYLSTVKNRDPKRELYRPFAARPPWSRWYPLVVLREKIMLRRRGDFDLPYLVDRRLFLAAKRVFELERWGNELLIEGGGNVETLKATFVEPSLRGDKKLWDFAAWNKMASWEGVLARYVQLMEGAIHARQLIEEDASGKLAGKTLIREYLSEHRARTTRVVYSLQKSDEEKEYLLGLLDTIFVYLTEKLAMPDMGELPTLYRIATPPGEGSYDVVVKPNDDVRVSVSGRDIILEYSARKDLMKGAVLVERETAAVATDAATLTVDAKTAVPEGIFWKVKDWNPGEYYLISFRYRTYGGPFRLRLGEAEVSRGETGQTVLIDDQLIASDWTRYQAVVRSGVRVDTAFLHVLRDDVGMGDRSIEIRDISMLHLPQATVLVKKRTPEIVRRSRPTLSVQKINSTKYRIGVSGATDPYVLVLNQEFSPRWRAFSASSELAAQRHFEVNGYANAWYVTPEDTGGKEAYELIVEMTTQWYFYAGSVLSVLTALASAWYGFFLWRRSAP